MELDNDLMIAMLQRDAARTELATLRAERDALREALALLRDAGESHMETHPSEGAAFHKANAYFYRALDEARAALAKGRP